jgi:hypothetical protein
MNSTWKAVGAFVLLIFILSGVGMLGSRIAFSHYDRVLSEGPPPQVEEKEAYRTGMSEKDYKKIRLAFNSFDLAAGLTRADFDNISSFNTYSFGTLWLCVGVIFFLQKPRKNK